MQTILKSHEINMENAKGVRASPMVTKSREGNKTKAPRSAGGTAEQKEVCQMSPFCSVS